MATRIANAWALQINRQGKLNHALNDQEIKNWVEIDAADEHDLYAVWKGLNLSGRGMHRLLKIARTIADLEGATSTRVKRAHLLEASALSKPINGMMN